MPTSQQFLLPKNQSLPQLFPAGAPFALHSDPARRREVTLLDTFDWRLHRKNWQLELCAGMFTLLFPDNIEFQQPTTATPPCRIESPDGNVAAKLAPVVQMRALLPVGTFTEIVISHRVLDDAQKNVAQLVEHHLQPTCPTPSFSALNFLEIHPHPEHPNITKIIAAKLDRFGAQPMEIPWREMVMRTCGNIPGGYSSKIKAQISPDLPAIVAVKILFQHLFSVMTANLPYITQDIDTEFLHDFRVAVRRTRVLLNQTKNVLAAVDIARFKQDFSFVGKSTNTLRDLDVYLLAKTEYRHLLPELLRDSILPLFDYLQNERATALKQVTRELQSDRFRQIMAAWETYLQTPPLGDTTAHITIGALARQRICRQYKRLMKHGKQSLSGADDTALHRLRIDGKKLRYLLEFFGDLFPKNDFPAAVKLLKQLQNNLGAHNDFRVQRDFLLDVARHHPPEIRWTDDTVQAINYLANYFEIQKSQEKNRFAEIFTDFSAPKNQARFEKLCAFEKGLVT